MNAITDTPAPLVFTDSAASKVKQLIDEEGNADLKLRVFVTGGGCSGFQYGFTFDEVQAAHIVVNGTINGPVHATETLELQAGSRVKGDVYYKSIEIHQGAVVEGRLVDHSAEAKGIELKLASGG